MTECRNCGHSLEQHEDDGQCTYLIMREIYQNLGYVVRTYHDICWCREGMNERYSMKWLDSD